MTHVQIVVRSAPREAVEIVERAFQAAGLETTLHVFSTNGDTNADVAMEIAEGQAACAHKRQAWIVPEEFAELEKAHARRAAAARAAANLPAREVAPKRLLILLDGDHPVVEADPNVVPLAALADGRFGPEQLRAAFP